MPAVGVLLGAFVGSGALAQSAPESPAPPEAPKPAEPAPPTEPAPPPAAPPAEPAPPPTAPPVEPTAPPAPPPSAAPAPSAPPPKTLAPAAVTLEETPEAAPAAGPAKGKKPHPKRRAHPPSEPPPEASPTEPRSRSAPPAAPPTDTTDGAAPQAGAKKEGEDAEQPSKDEDDGEGLFGPFRIGVLVGVGLPSLVSFGGMIKLTRYLGAGLNVGLIPAIKLSLYGDAELSYQEYDIYGRLFPFGGNLFVGAGVGYASISGSFKSKPSIPPALLAGTNLSNPLSLDSEGSVRTLVLTPTIGFLHTFGSGFTIGIDLGAQLPIAPSTTHFKTTLPPGVPQPIIDQFVKPNDKKVQDTLDTVGRTILPTLNLRVGWLL